MKHSIFAVMILLALSVAAAPGQVPAPAAGGASGAAAAGGATAGAAGGAPTVEELTALLQQKQYQDVLRGVARALNVRGDAAKVQDRYALLMLRGEASLHTGALPAAAEAFAAAAKETDDPQKQPIARADEILVRRSRATGYIPKTGARPGAAAAAGAAAAPAGAAPGATAAAGAGAAPGATAANGAGAAPSAAGGATAAAGVVPPAAPAVVGKPIPILEDADRKAAFAALFQDEVTAAAPKVKAAAAATALPPVIEAARPLGDLRAVEIAATGSDAQTKQLGTNVGARAHQLIDAAIKKMSDRVEQCWTQGSRTRWAADQRGNNQQKLYGMMGLTSVETNDLKSALATAQKIQPVASDLASVTGSAELLADAQAAQKLAARANEVLTYDYANEGRNPGQSVPQPPPGTAAPGSGGYGTHPHGTTGARQ